MTQKKSKLLISQQEAMECLNVVWSDFDKIRKESYLNIKETVTINGRYTSYYYDRNEVLNIKATRERFLECHMSSKEAVEILHLKYDKIPQFIGRVKIPAGLTRYHKHIKNNTYMYTKEEVYKARDYNDLILQSCLSVDASIEYLETNPRSFWALVKEYKLEVKFLFGRNDRNFYFKDDLDEIKNDIKTFFENHFTLKESYDILGVEKNAFERLQLNKINIPNGYSSRRAATACYMYRKEDVLGINTSDIIRRSERYRVNYDEHTGEVKSLYTIDSSEYISHPDALRYLDLNIDIFVELIKELKLEICHVQKGRFKVYYRRLDIENIKGKQNQFWQDHISLPEIKHLHGRMALSTKQYLSGFVAINVPLYAKTKSSNYGLHGLRSICYKRVEILDRIDSINEQAQIWNTSSNTYFDTFNARLLILDSKLQEFNASDYTREKWTEFVNSKLVNTQHPKTANQNINKFVRLTILINDSLKNNNVSEVYSLKPGEVAMLYNIANLSQRKTLLGFLESVEEDVRYRLYESNEINNIGFSLTKIKARKEPLEDQPTNDIVDIYDFEEYQKVFNFLVDIKLHVRNSIKKMSVDDNIVYPSLWLYLMLHLNNAWRHGDISDFPRLYIQDLMLEYSIKGIGWFKDNEITVEQARRVITRVISSEFKISKTQLKGEFFSSDVLAPAIATGIMLIEAFLESRNSFDDGVEYLPLLDFRTKFNQPSDAQLSNFFHGIDNGWKFEFKSRKMNRTIMTFIYHLSHMSGDDNALKYVQRLRGHDDPSSPLNYLNLNIKRIEGLTEVLFKRGEFGYIPSLIVERLQGKSLSFEDMTLQVEKVNSTFCDVFKLESTVGFLNTVKHERARVARLIETETLENCQILLTEIFTGNLPSREKGLQCLVSKQGCQRPDKKCFDCEYHIPSIYVLTSLCMALIEDIKGYHKTNNNIKKMKKALGIERKMIVFQEAIQKYGREYVYNSLGISRDQLLKALEEIPGSAEFGRLFPINPTLLE